MCFYLPNALAILISLPNLNAELESGQSYRLVNQILTYPLFIFNFIFPVAMGTYVFCQEEELYWKFITAQFKAEPRLGLLQPMIQCFRHIAFVLVITMGGEHYI